VISDPRPPRSHRRRSRPRSRPWRSLFLAIFLLAATCAALLGVATVGRIYPLETLIVSVIILFALLGVALYVGELVVIGWVMDLLLWLSMLGLHAKEKPLDYEQVGEMIVVKLSDNIVSVRQCRSVEKQLQRLTAEGYCDFILDFSGIGKISLRFRRVMLRLSRMARRQAARLGKPYRRLPLPRGDAFLVFDDSRSAVEEMGGHEGHGWVVLSAVPAGLRAVSEGG
jgi:hypothetical protein